MSKVIIPDVITPRVPLAALRVPANVALPVTASNENVVSPSLAPTKPPLNKRTPLPLVIAPVVVFQAISPVLNAPA